MNKIILISAFLLGLSFFSCEEDFSPYGEFRENYILTCVLRSDTAYQTATLSRSYFTGTNDPYDNEIDPSIRFADVRVWYEDSVYVLHDSTTVRIDTSRYKTPESFYVTNRFKVEQNKPIEIEVLLQNGRRLKASSVTPREILFSNQSEVLVPPVNTNKINIVWGNGNPHGFYLPKLQIRYSVRIGNSTTFHRLEVPLRYEIQDGDEVPVYPTPSNKVTIMYDKDVVSKTLTELRESASEDMLISVYAKISMRVAILDENLSRYASSVSHTFDDLTVRVNELDYSNVEGGYGIFGSYIIKDYERLRFQQNFIESFGLRFVNEL